MNGTNELNPKGGGQFGQASHVLNEVNSIAEEYDFLSGYYKEFYEMSSRVVKDYMDEVNRKADLTPGESMFSELQHYLLLADPDITLICEQYNQFRLIKERYSSVADRVCEIENKFLLLKQRNDILRAQIEDNDKYFEQFKELYEKHVENWHLLENINTTEKKYGYWALFTSAMELYQDKVKLVLSPRIFMMLEKLEKNLITVEELRYSKDYREIKDFITDVRANKEYLITEVTKILRLHFPALNKKKAEKLTDVHKVYINSVNNLFEKKYMNIPRKSDVQSSFYYLEDAIKSLKQEYDNLKES